MIPHKFICFFLNSQICNSKLLDVSHLPSKLKLSSQKSYLVLGMLLLRLNFVNIYISLNIWLLYHKIWRRNKIVLDDLKSKWSNSDLSYKLFRKLFVTTSGSIWLVHNSPSYSKFKPILSIRIRFLCAAVHTSLSILIKPNVIIQVLPRVYLPSTTFLQFLNDFLSLPNRLR